MENNYEQKYKKALDNARLMYDAGNNDVKHIVGQLFPELAESEDEKVRKKLINLVKKSYEQGGYALHKWEADEMLAWLEKHSSSQTKENNSLKQSEQKVNYTTIAKTGDGGINAIVTRELPIDDEQRPTDEIKPFDKYEGLTDFERTLADICIGWIGEELGWKEYIKDNADVLLKIAIKKFNSVQGVPFGQNLAIEMKSAEESLGVDSGTYNKIVDECIFGEQKPTDKVEGRIQPQPKQDWSDEDENLYIICSDLMFGSDGEYADYLKKEAINWFKSLKDKVQPQPKQGWSEEDEKIINGLIDSLTRISLNTRTDSTSPNYTFYKEIDWLKSLRHQNRWKPSNKQMEALKAMARYCEIATSFDACKQRIVESLYNDLKKLKEE